MEINWQQFGLKTNPYDTFPLAEGGGLALKEAFIGREKERKIINSHFRSNNRICLSVCGETGVGKTSLVNYEKFVWKYSKEQKQLFSSRSEIQASDILLNKQSFLIEIIGSVLREIQLVQPDLLKNELLANLQQIVDVRQYINISGGLSLGAQGFGAGVNVSKERQNTPSVRFSMGILEQYFHDLLGFIQTHDIKGRRYQGLIVHVNNFDWVLAEEGGKKKARTFFNEVRDVLQTPGTYFLFLGTTELFTEVIAKEQRVKSIFIRTPTVVKPLSKKEVVEAFEKRMELFTSEGVQEYIKPIDDEVVYKLHDLYQGDIRSIMVGIKDILSGYSDQVVQTLTVNEAMSLLGEERWSQIKDLLTKEQKEVLFYMVKHGKSVSVSEIALALKKQPANISGYYFPPLKDHGVIEEGERVGKKVHYGLTTEYTPLRWWMESREAVAKSASKSIIQQPSLFRDN